MHNASSNVIKQDGIKHNASSNVIKQDGIKHNASSNVIKHDRINALILFHMFAISFSTCYRVGKRTAWILIRLSGCAGKSGSMLVASTLCWFCRDVAHFFVIFKCSLVSAYFAPVSGKM
jgi:hypothetical protein